MEKTNASKQGVLHWLDVKTLRRCLRHRPAVHALFITWQVIYRYIITQFIERAGAAVWTGRAFSPLHLYLDFHLRLSVAIKKRSSIRGLHALRSSAPRFCSRSAGSVEVRAVLHPTATIATMAGADRTVAEYRSIPRLCASPFLIPYLILPFGFGLMCFRLLQSSQAGQGLRGWWIPDRPPIAVFAIASPVIFRLHRTAARVVRLFHRAVRHRRACGCQLGLSTLATIICADTSPIEYMAQGGLSRPSTASPIMAIPFFIAAGVFMGGRAFFPLLQLSPRRNRRRHLWRYRLTAAIVDP